MRRLTAILFCLLPLLHAAQNIGVLSASGDIRLRGVNIPAAGTKGLSISSGDEFHTNDSNAILRLRDGSLLEFGPGVQAGFEYRENKTFIYLWNGRMKFTLPSAQTWRAVEFCAMGIPVVGGALTTGLITVDSPAGTVKLDVAPESIQLDRSRICGIGNSSTTALWAWPTPKQVALIFGAGVLVGAGGAIAIYEATDNDHGTPASAVKP